MCQELGVSLSFEASNSERGRGALSSRSLGGATHLVFLFVKMSDDFFHHHVHVKFKENAYTGMRDFFLLVELC